MQTLKTAILTASAAILLLVSPAIARATSFSSIIVYGDSLSDNGNLFAADGGTVPAAPYYMGQFSNGPVAVVQMAAALGVPLFDFAFGGATAGVGDIADGGTQTTLGTSNVPGMLTQLALFPPPAALVPTSLFVVWGGANDFEIDESPAVAAADIDFIVASLLSQGATHILVPGLPDLGKTPEFSGPATAAAATLYTQQFNQDLLAGLPLGATYFDTYAFLNAIVANPGAYGFTNVTGQCLVGTTPCANPGQYLFWDDIHPTTATDALLAQQFEAAVIPTPEPSSILLLGTGITGLATAILRRRRAA